MPGNSRSLSAYPLRLVYRLVDGPMAEDGGVGEKALLISVPKRCFKHAVDRNKVKRQVREAYRAHRGLLALPDGKSATLAFIWLDSKHHPSDVVCAKVCNLMQRMQEAIHKHIQKEKAAEELEKAEMGKMVEGND